MNTTVKNHQLTKRARKEERNKGTAKQSEKAINRIVIVTLYLSGITLNVTI